MSTASISDIVMNLNEAASFLRVPEEAVLRAINEQALEGRQIGGEWRFLRSAIEDWLRHRSPKARMLAVAGSMKNDPYMEELLRNIYAERERQRSEESCDDFPLSHRLQPVDSSRD